MLKKERMKRVYKKESDVQKKEKRQTKRNI